MNSVAALRRQFESGSSAAGQASAPVTPVRESLRASAGRVKQAADELEAKERERTAQQRTQVAAGTPPPKTSRGDTAATATATVAAVVAAPAGSPLPAPSAPAAGSAAHALSPAVTSHRQLVERHHSLYGSADGTGGGSSLLAALVPTLHRRTPLSSGEAAAAADMQVGRGGRSEQQQQQQQQQEQEEQEEQEEQQQQQAQAQAAEAAAAAAAAEAETEEG